MNASIFQIQADFCKAMGNADRLQILHLLREGAQNASGICRETGMTQANVSRHLSVLRAVGVLVSRRVGTETLHELTDSRISEVCDLVRSVLIEQIREKSRLIE